MLPLALVQAGSAQHVCVSDNGVPADPSALLDIQITSLPNAGKKGLLLPRMTTAQREMIAAPADGLMVQITDGPQGFWHYDADAARWVQWGALPWRLTGNVGTDPAHHFVGTTDAQPFIIRANGSAGIRITTLGQWVPEYTGSSVLIGIDAAHGMGTPANERNTYLGPGTGFGNGVDPSTGTLNTAAGPFAAVYLATGHENSTVGYWAGRTNQFGDHNSMAGANTDIPEVYDWHHHQQLVALGYGAEASTWGTAAGTRTRAGKATNVAPTFHGALALGSDARADTVNSAALGHGATALTAHSVRVGNTAVSSIGGYAPWTDLSDIRFKADVHSLEQGMALIGRLRPIVYRHDPEQLHPPGTTATAQDQQIRTGLSAQDLEAALVHTGAPMGLLHQPQHATDHYAVNYAGLVPHLVKAVQERDAANAELATRIAHLRERLNILEASIR